MAAVVFGEHLRRAGLTDLVTTSSAGIEPWHAGGDMDERAAATLAQHGYRPEHVAAQVGAQHLTADLFLAMDSGHARALRRLVAEPERVRMFRSFDPAASDDLDVPDPYFGADDGFLEVLAMIEAATPGLIDWVSARVDR
jgi:protein-tyrosine phosphatase